MTPVPRLTVMLRRLLPFVVSVVLAAGAVLLLSQDYQQRVRALVKERDRMMADFQSPTEVLVAAKDLPEGTKVEEAHLAVAAVPQKFVQPFATRSPADVVGMVTAAPIAEGEQLLVNKLRRPDVVPASATLSGVMPKGKRAVTIGVDAITGVGGFVRPGDAVDVLWTVKLPGAAQEVITLTLFQDIPGSAVGNVFVGRVTRQAESTPQYTVTLALTPQEASFLLFAREQGKVQLSLRPRQEEGIVAMAPATSATFNAFMESQFGLEARPAVKPVRQIEVYKGLKRDVVLLSEEGLQTAP